jgi:hypothetical protein
MAANTRSVFSSHISTVGYDDASGNLTVAYQNGKTSVHAGVPPDVAAKVMGSASIGQALHKHIRGRFDHSYLGG